MRKFLLHLQGTKKPTLPYFSVTACIFLMVFSTSVCAKTYDIAIISSGNSTIYSRIIESVKNTITQRNSLSVSFTVFNADEISKTTITKIHNSDILLTIGQRAMLATTQLEKSPPIVATLIPRLSFQNNLPALKFANDKVSAIYIGSPSKRQIFLAKILLGEMQTVGILLSKNTSTDKNQIISTLNNVGLNFIIGEVSSADKIIQKLSHTINSSDALLAFPDPIIFNRNTTRNILLTTYRQRIPVIAFSSNYVKAGALAATFSTPEQIAQQTGRTIINILTGIKPFPHGGRYPEEFNIAVNQNVARSLSIITPPVATIKKSLDKLLGKYK